MNLSDQNISHSFQFNALHKNIYDDMALINI